MQRHCPGPPVERSAAGGEGGTLQRQKASLVKEDHQAQRDPSPWTTAGQT